MTAEVSPRTRKVTAALRLYRDKDDENRTVERATLYLKTSPSGPSAAPPTGRAAWTEEDRDEHGLGVVPVVPLVNRTRIGRRHGVSELSDVIDLTDAAARALTLAQLATETLSVPQRAVLGASAGDFQDKDGKVLPVWEAYFGAVWALENPEAKVSQFSAADLANFKTIVDHYASLVSSVTGLAAALLRPEHGEPAERRRHPRRRVPPRQARRAPSARLGRLLGAGRAPHQALPVRLLGRQARRA
jgi:hypothetical protein